MPTETEPQSPPISSWAFPASSSLTPQARKSYLPDYTFWFLCARAPPPLVNLLKFNLSPQAKLKCHLLQATWSALPSVSSKQKTSIISNSSSLLQIPTFQGRMRQGYWRQKEIFQMEAKWAFFSWFSPLSVNWPESAACSPTSWPSPAIWSVSHPRAGPTGYLWSRRAGQGDYPGARSGCL